MKKPQKLPVISAAGKRDTRLVMFGRIGYGIGVATTLLTLAQILGTTPLTKPSGTQTALIITGILLAFTASFFELWYGGHAARKEEKRIRHTLLQRLFAQEKALTLKNEGEAEHTNDGHLIAMLTDNTERVVEFRQVYFGSTLAAIAIPFLTLTYVTLAIDWLTGLTLILMVPVIPIGVRGFMKLFAKTSANSRKQRGKLASRYLDAIRNLVLIRLHGAAGRIENELKEQGETNRKAIMKLLAGNQIVIIVLDGLFSLCLIVVASALSYYRHQSGAIELTDVFSIIFLSFLLLEPLNQIAGFFYIGMGGMASEKSIRKYLTETNPTTNPQETHTNNTNNTLTTADPELAIQVRDLHFNYGRGPVLNGINLDVLHGSKIAIIGRSGGGKTTLLKLLKGSLPLQTGNVYINGKNLQNTPAQANEIAYVAQKTWLFTGTIRDNLLMAKPAATDAEIWNALERANLAAEIRSMGGQLDASVGEQGALISGGQAQRLSLARAFLSERKILILDEPTAQVDIDSEAKLIEAISNINQDHTVILVTHRLALLQLADTIFTLANGKLTNYSHAQTTPGAADTEQGEN